MPDAAARPPASVVVSTFNGPDHLEMVLAGFARQTTKDFELLVADDGSGEETAAVIEEARRAGFPAPLIHVWQPDAGYRKARAVSWAVLNSRGRHLIFCDGDCVPPARMVERHLRAGGANTLVVGGYIRTTPEQAASLDVEAIRAGRHETLISLRQRARLQWRHVQNLWYIASGAKRRPKIGGANVSVDRDTFYAVNGFDLNYQNSGREDSDLRNRLRLHGARARCIWHSCIVVHLWHPEHLNRNAWAEVDAYYRRPDLAPRTEHGLRELAAELGVPLHPDPSKPRRERIEAGAA
jgi:glycosyltransferase involved in cell wall biosynthesis